MIARWQAIRAFARALVASRWAKPALRIVAASAGLLLLAAVGRSALARDATGEGASTTSASTLAASSEPTPTPIPRPSPAPAPTAPAAPSSVAPADAPVILNIATPDDLERLPGIGPKKAEAIIALRQRMGHFRQVEDLMKVKGIGRATVRRLRPFVRVDPPPSPIQLPQPAALDASTT